MSDPLSNVRGPVEVSGDEAVERIARFRYAVWAASGLMDPTAFPDGRWRDDLDDQARHLVLEAEGRLVGAARYTQWERMDDMPEGAYYRSIGLDLDGPIGLPQRVVVTPEARRRGLSMKLADGLLHLGIEMAARYILAEASAGAVRMMLKRGRRHVGPAPYDARFPGVRFQIMLTDMRELGRYRG